MNYLEVADPVAGVPVAEPAEVPEAEADPEVAGVSEVSGAEAAGIPEAGGDPEDAEVPLNKNIVITVCWTCCTL